MTLGTGIAVAGIAIGIGVIGADHPLMSIEVGVLAVYFTAMFVLTP